jgi:2-C-methyl-D-erythritol 2,4-cyclodiphosphate synthase
MTLLSEKGFSVGNVDCTVCAEEPKLNAYIPQMQTCLANLMQLDDSDVSSKHHFRKNGFCR